MRRIKIPRDIAERELERLKRLFNEEISGDEDYFMLPMIIRNELTRMGDKKEVAEAEKFWSRIWKPISKQASHLKPTFIADVAKETGLSKETIRKLLKQAVKKKYD